VVTIRRKPELAFKAVGGITGEVTGEVQRLLAVANLQTANSKQQTANSKQQTAIPAPPVCTRTSISK
jgi:hypothetical protein